MELILGLLTDPKVLGTLGAILTGLLVVLFKKGRKKVAESETKLDDELLEAVEDAVKKSKEEEDNSG